MNKHLFALAAATALATPAMAQSSVTLYQYNCPRQRRSPKPRKSR
ncbi:MAG: hypothetical protein Q7U14_04120 [Lacisediminimonas sp.]|nr:hypothetical protein [Lacisediminimonas sp.]